MMVRKLEESSFLPPDEPHASGRETNGFGPT
jgi:hypothetical protein